MGAILGHRWTLLIVACVMFLVYMYQCKLLCVVIHWSFPYVIPQCDVCIDNSHLISVHIHDLITMRLPTISPHMYSPHITSAYSTLYMYMIRVSCTALDSYTQLYI